jgi:hypothetical protein
LGKCSIFQGNSGCRDDIRGYQLRLNPAATLLFEVPSGVSPIEAEMLTRLQTDPISFYRKRWRRLPRGSCRRGATLPRGAELCRRRHVMTDAEAFYPALGAIDKRRV